ncbi:hypothetical protein KY336_01135 [Candidatus Woesearchaeota archaeon]|nr:hypothetical protein [Candidatus Woesearchaeota archaeon]
MDDFKVKLRTEVEYGVLEDALLKAGSDMGWNTKVDHKYDIEYRLGTEVEEKKTYVDTTISLTSNPKKRNEDVMLFIMGLDRNEPTNHFRINAGCSRPDPGKIKNYLEKVVGYLNTRN